MDLIRVVYRFKHEIIDLLEQIKGYKMSLRGLKGVLGEMQAKSEEAAECREVFAREMAEISLELGSEDSLRCGSLALNESSTTWVTLAETTNGVFESVWAM